MTRWTLKSVVFLYSLVTFLSINIVLAGSVADTPNHGGTERIEFETLLGFYTSQHLSIPKAVRVAENSIFELRTLAVFSDDYIQTFDLSKQTPEQLASIIDSNANFDSLDKIVLKAQIQKCLDLKVSDCPVTSDIRNATGFLFGGSGDRLWTNAHVVEGYIKAAIKYEELSLSDVLKVGRNITTFVFNSNGELVVNPYKKAIKINSIPEVTPFAQLRDNFYAEDSDLIELKLEEAIGTPLLSAKKNPKFRERIYILGYAACTGCKNYSVNAKDISFMDRSPMPNSSGDGLQITLGNFLGNNVAPLNYFFEASIFAVNLIKPTAFYFSGDGHHGMSGGPILNEAGEVAGIYSGGEGKLVEGRLQRLGRGVFMPIYNIK